MKDAALIGLSKDAIPTPALVLDADIFESNIRSMMSWLAGTSVSLRPHAKTHKTPMIGHLQMRSGAIGLCCATVAEAEAMVHAGLDHILITSQVVGQDKIRRVAALARYADVMVAVDDVDNIRQLSEAAAALGVTLGIILEIDVGMGRCGARNVADAVKLAGATTRSKGLAFKGVMGYEGHVVFIEDRTERSAQGGSANAGLVQTAEAIRQAGIPVEIVSAAGTGTFDIAGAFKGITELQCGSYIFMDLTYAKLDLPFEYALTVLSTVISRPVPETAVLDCGLKSISVEREPPRALDCPGLEILKLSEEHAKGHVQPDSTAAALRSGDRVHLIPSHCCSTVNLHDCIYVVRRGLVEAVWTVAARGIH
jgi:D-serine deaminase-like pyridoxal phosphate-dependent protein